ncbi:hypothetical protein G7Z17_g10597 [Cylindrodendrum hubeiense]|uniref:Uncharacterized protein n=1 Tax=Cylindrodendrum hubeiense TaxID=595255 RepID=A0A9P5H5N4_9HYPO|nr:hypothetical protein G7Z17_g10597 [Cylindrodendrum hubeiense]
MIPAEALTRLLPLGPCFDLLNTIVVRGLVIGDGVGGYTQARAQSPPLPLRTGPAGRGGPRTPADPARG